MRVALVIEHLDPRRGGVEEWTWQFARWLAARRVEVHVVARSFSAEAEAASLARHYVQASPGRLAFADAAERIVAQLGPIVVHDTGCGWRADVFQPHGGSRQAAFERNLALLPGPLRGLKRWSTRWLPRYREFEALAARQYDAREGRLFIALSRMVADDLQRDYGVPSAQLRIVYNGVDTARFTPEHRQTHRDWLRMAWGIRRDEIVALLVAHNFRLKGGPQLVAAVERLRGQGLPLRLVVAGGPLRPSRGGVLYLGSVRDPQHLYAGADLYAHPTFYDPCSLVLLEALASGLPVLTTRFNGAGELVAPGVEGHVIDDPGNAAALDAALVDMADPARRDAMGLAARRLALRHDWQRNGEELLAIYRELSTARRAA